MTSQTPPIVYLAGPIQGMSYSEATDWRKYVEKHLDPNIMCLSPMRYKTWLRDKQIMPDSEPTKIFGSDRGITTRDRLDVMRSDCVLVNFLGITDKSIGTCIELGWADAWRKPVIVIMHPGNVHDHAMVRDIAGYFATSLHGGMDIAMQLLLPEFFRG